MKKEELVKALRCWTGFRLMFSGTDLNLDEELIPVLKMPKADSKQKHAAFHNITRVLRNKDSDVFSLFFVCVGIQNRGVIPYPLELLSETQISKMHSWVSSMFEILNSLDYECSVLWKEKHDFESLLESCVKGEISVPAAACYAKRFRIEKIDLGIERGLVSEQIENVMETCFKLEKRYDFFKKYRLLVQRNSRVYE